MERAYSNTGHLLAPDATVVKSKSAANTPRNTPPKSPDLTRTMSADFSDWNPFSDDNFGTYSEDIIFGKEFDKLRRGSNSSISNVKSREDLVMSASDSPDPFANAPFKKHPKPGDDGNKMEDEQEPIKDDDQDHSLSESRSYDLFGAAPFVKAAWKRTGKYKQFTDAYDDRDEQEPSPILLAEAIASATRVNKSSSGENEDQVDAVDSSSANQVIANFGYKELDDEFGRRSGKFTKGRESPEAFEMVQEVVVGKPAPNREVVVQDSGVKPLLDDDELEYNTTQGQNNDKPVGNDDDFADIRDDPGDKNVFDFAPFPKLKSRNNKVNKYTSSHTSVMTTSSPIHDDSTLKSNLQKCSKSPISTPDRGDSTTLFDPSLLRPEQTTSNSLFQTETNKKFFYGPNTMKKSSSLQIVSSPKADMFPKRNASIAHDPFGCVPFGDVLFKQTQDKFREMNAEKDKLFEWKADEDSDAVAMDDAETELISLSPKSRHAEKEHVDKTVEASAKSPTSSKHYKSRTKTRSSPHDKSISAFSNMSFHDDDDSPETVAGSYAAKSSGDVNVTDGSSSRRKQEKTHNFDTWPLKSRQLKTPQ